MRCAVLGSPIAHSLSPVLHRAGYAELGLTEWRYDAYEVDEAGLGAFMDRVDPAAGWRGLSLTMPLKRAAIDVCDAVSPLARRVGAVNTIVFTADGRRLGGNTDVPGVAAALGTVGLNRVTSAVLLGAGATAASVLASLASLGLQRATVLARNPARSGDLHTLAGELGIRLSIEPWDTGRTLRPGELAGGFDLAVSTVPADAAAGAAVALASAAPVGFDVVYHPWPSPFASAASASGATLVGGLELLVQQAALQLEQMTGKAPAPIDAMRSAGQRALTSH